jgi:tetratricopeptide (TPR) repeat protein
LVGYAAGVLGVLIFLRAGWIEREGYDLLLMLQQWNRRRRYRDAVSEGYNPYSVQPGRRSVEAREVPKSPEQQRREAHIQKLRGDIGQWLAQHNVATAAQLYVDLMAVDDAQILPRQPLLDMANQLASEKRYTEAARAYEQILTHYRSYEHVEQVMLMLGLIYARYLRRTERAREVLNQALTRLVDPNQQAMCREELARLVS